MAEISVIIPVYNAEKYIAGCLDALCAQTFGDIEVLCVDDGSTDGSGSILAEYAGKDPRIRVFPQANSGPAAARNLGLKNAGGRYVMFCDADDSYRPDCCERMLRAMTEKRPDVAVCRCRVEIEEVDTEARRHTVSESFYNAPYTGMHVLDDELRVKMSVVLWNKIFAKELIERYGICFPEGCEHDDDTFWMLYSLFAKDVYFLSERLYNYRIRVNSIMSNYFNKKPKNKYDRYRVCNFVYDFLQRKGLLEANLAAVSDFYRRQAGNLFPQRVGFFVVMINGYRQPVCRQVEILGQKFPGIADGAFFKIVAEREVAEHFKESVVADVVAHTVEVVVFAAGAHAFLRRGGAGIIPGFVAGKNVFKLHHPRVGKHQGRVVVGHERG